MLTSSAATLLFAFASVQATAIQQRQSCTTVASGYLSATVNGVLHSFTTTTSGAVGYTGTGTNPIYVDMQACQSSQDNDWGEYTGRLYVPATDQCVTVTNQASSQAPYYPVIGSCQFYGQNPISAQMWDYRTGEGGALRWLGKTDWEGSIPQGECGQFGYTAHDGGVPTLTSSGQIILNCYDSTVTFKLSSTAN